jgi:hypothetical protein
VPETPPHQAEARPIVAEGFALHAYSVLALLTGAGADSLYRAFRRVLAEVGLRAALNHLDDELSGGASCSQPPLSHQRRRPSRPENRLLRIGGAEGFEPLTP